MNQGTNLGSQIGRWIILAALVAVLGALLLTIRPVGAQDATPTIPNAETVFNYAENGTGPVTTYRARDPEGNRIFWTLSGVDANDFTIVGGALRFRSPPDYENPTDRDEDLESEVDRSAGDNIYRVTVRFGAGGQDGTPGVDDYDGDDLGELDLTVTVTNVDEAGRVYISSLQPQVGTELIATVTDLDGVAVTGSWQWASSDSENGPFTDIPDRSNDDTYRPVEDDLDKYLQVTGRYRDNVSGADIREKAAVSAYPVRTNILSSNDPPEYPDQTTLGIDTEVAIERTLTERFILENSPAGTRVGAPVTAFDDATEIEVLTYSLSDTMSGSDDARSFGIDPATGQITVSASARLNAEVDPYQDLPAPFAAADPFLVTVRAIDGDGDTADIDVTIMVVGVNEPPKIGARPGINAEPNVVAAREMSHYESDRTDRSATEIDIDLDTSVLDYTTGSPPPDLRENRENLDAATYAATDPEDLDNTLRWSLAGPDATMIDAAGNRVPVFVIDTTPLAPPKTTVGATATLGFASRPNFPDFEMPRGKPKSRINTNVYEVTLVVTDSVGETDEYDVTVKVINSTDDNRPGKVTILNRQPEVARTLTATFEDSDRPISDLKWQWYRSVDPGANRTRCVDYDPHAPAAGAAQAVRYFLDPPADGAAAIDAAWQAIPGATLASYTPGYDEDSGGTRSVNPDGTIVTWRDGDIDVVTTTTTTQDGRVESSVWENPKCLRATVTYRDGVDRTNTEADVNGTTVDETLEGTFKGSEFPVKPIDKNNEAPVFTDNGLATGNAVSRYTAERREDASVATTTDSRTINEASPATDDATDEDDFVDLVPAGYGPDILTYTLGGPDAAAFTITGTVGDLLNGQELQGLHVENTELAKTEGELSFKDEAVHELDFESKPRYTVTITATDPSGLADTVTVTVDITNFNEMPTWEEANSPTRVVYAENGTADVGTYLANDPEGAGITYSLETEDGETYTDGTEIIQVVLADRQDSDLLEINRLDGTLSFKSSPNYEKPADGLVAGVVAANTNNMYQIVVKATVVDNPPLTNDADALVPHAIHEKVTVIVTNVNEVPVFSETTDTLEISENADDPEKEPPSAAGYLYLLNRGVGKPSATLPAATDLDVGIPVVAVDDDSSGNFAIGGYIDLQDTDPDRDPDRIDGLTYTLSGTDAAHFHVVPATGQILTLEKLDYEAKNEYKVTVKATDPMGESDSIDMTIEVTDVDEVPVPRVLAISGDASHTYEENGTDALGEYKVVAGGGAMVGAWSLDGTDASNFMLTGTGDSRMLKFASAPDYEDPMGGANDDSNTYDVTLKVTDSSESDVYGTFAVSVTVTNVDELGTLSGPETASINEGDTDVLGTYTLTGGPASYTYFQSLEGDDAGQFTLNVIGTTGVLELSFSSAPDYEAPADADGDNTYEVTVKATAGGEETMVAATVTVANVEEGGTVTLTPARPSVGTEITATLEDGDIVSTVTWSWGSGDNADGTGFSGIGTNSATYTPVAADVGKYIGAWATYNDGYDTGNIQNKVSESVVTQVAVNAPPAFSSATATRTIAENTAANTIIGSPVAATDPNDDPLTYRLEGTDAASFSIDRSTGQLRTSAALDFETKSTYNVVVRASDPAGLSDTINVAITVTDVVEVVPEVPAIVQGYDTNNDGAISIPELFVAIDDYFNEELSISELFDVIDAYFG